jgi:replicative DNA helicase
MTDLNQPIDHVTLSDWLRFAGVLEQVGGLVYLNNLEAGATHPLNIGWYIDTVLEHWSGRQLLKVCQETVNRVMERDDTTAALIDNASQRIFDLGQGQVTEEETGIRALLDGAISTIQTAYDNRETVTGLATGFSDLDAMTSGLHAGEMVVIAGRPGRGKTAIAMNIAENVAVDQRIPVGCFSLEMTAESLILRMLCSRARINYRDVTRGYVAQEAFPRLASAHGQMANAPLYINDKAGLTILGLRTRARLMQRKHDIQLLIVDYVQLLSGERRYQDSRQQEMSNVSAGIKAMAKELKIPVIALAQLNRQVELDKRRKPRLSDLRESGSFENDADVVAFLYALKGKDNETDNPETPRVNLYIAKQRNGPTGDVPLVFLKSFTRFVPAVSMAQDAEPEPDSDEQPDLI